MRFTPRREQIFDYRYVIHDLRLNDWVIADRKLIGDKLMAWDGPDEARVAPPRHVAPYERARALDLRLKDDCRPVAPDAIVEVVDAEEVSRSFYLEYDRTRRVDKNYDKFRRYDALISAWWHLGPRAEEGQPYAVFI